MLESLEESNIKRMSVERPEEVKFEFDPAYEILEVRKRELVKLLRRKYSNGPVRDFIILAYDLQQLGIDSGKDPAIYRGDINARVEDFEKLANKNETWENYLFTLRFIKGIKPDYKMNLFEHTSAIAALNGMMADPEVRPIALFLALTNLKSCDPNIDPASAELKKRLCQESIDLAMGCSNPPEQIELVTILDPEFKITISIEQWEQMKAPHAELNNYEAIDDEADLMNFAAHASSLSNLSKMLRQKQVQISQPYPLPEQREF